MCDYTKAEKKKRREPADTMNKKKTEENRGVCFSFFFYIV